jgi:TonB family protein
VSGSGKRLVFRVSAPSSPLAPFISISVLIHMAFVVVLVLNPSFRGRAAIPEDVLIVDLVGGFSSPEPAAPSATAPAPTVRETEPEGVRMEPEEVPPKPKKKKPKPKPPPEPEPASSSPPREGQPMPGGPAGPADGRTGSPGAGGVTGGSIASLDLGDLAQAWYADSVKVALKTHWTRPVLEGVRDPLEVTVAFEIRPDGAVANLRVETPSGVPSLDRSALRAVADASPLPAPPPTWRGRALPARFLFRWHPDGP